MAFPWGVFAFVAGLFYGWLSPGRQDKMRMLRTGLLIGLALAVIFSLLGWVLDASPLGMGAGFVVFLLGAIVLTLLFVVGVWVGDFIEGATKRKTA